MENISIKEVFIGIAVTLVILALAIFIEPFLKDGMMKEIRMYQDALRVNNDAKMFSYAKKTNVGNVLAYGEIEALQPQKIEDLLDSYMAVTKVKEHYTEHSRQVEHETCSGSGKNRTCETYYTTEYYWTWDSVQQWNWVSPNYKFLDVEFQYSQLILPSYYNLPLNPSTINSKYVGFYNEFYLYEQSVLGQPTGDDRYYFQVLPNKFITSLFVRFMSDKVTDPNTNGSNLAVLANQTPDQIIQQKKDNLIAFDWIYYISIAVITIVIWGWIAYQILDIE